MIEKIVKVEIAESVLNTGRREVFNRLHCDAEVIVDRNPGGIVYRNDG